MATTSSLLPFRALVVWMDSTFFCCCSGKSAAGFDLSGVIASEADFSKGDFKEVVMSKAYARVRLSLAVSRALAACVRSTRLVSYVKVSLYTAGFVKAMRKRCTLGP